MPASGRRNRLPEQGTQDPQRLARMDFVLLPFRSYHSGKSSTNSVKRGAIMKSLSKLLLLLAGPGVVREKRACVGKMRLVIVLG